MIRTYFLFISILFFFGCGDSSTSSISNASTETAPDLIGDWYIPLGDLEYKYEYSYRLDSNSLDFKQQDIYVDINQYSDEDYSYGFSNNETGILLSHLRSPIEKSGTYYSGYYNKDTLILADTLHLYIPQFPKKGAKWNLWNHHLMEVIAIDTTIMLKFNTNHSYNDLNPHKVVIYKESWDYNEIYHFYKANIGLVAQQRNFNGYLISWGELTSLY